MAIYGVLFLTAGYGTRVEPFSLVRPKALLPFADTTIIGRIAGQVSTLEPHRIGMNSSRCPGRLLEELANVWPKEQCRLYFEERPLGTSATIARNTENLEGGTWMIVNTDMIIQDLDLSGMVDYHRYSGSDWTVMTGAFPESGEYSPLLIDDDDGFGSGKGRPVHYWGISLMEPGISRLAMEIQAQKGLFTELAGEALNRGFTLRSWSAGGSWLDMGDGEQLRENILCGGSFIHPTASVSAGAVLTGSWNIGPGCSVSEGTEISDSVMLEGSSLESGRLRDSIAPWFMNLQGNTI